MTIRPRRYAIVINSLSYFFARPRTLICMNNNILKGMVTRCSDYSFQIGSYSFPKQIKSYSGKIIDLEQNRLQNLQQGESNGSRLFEYHLINKNKGLRYYKEFPFILGDTNLWEEICKFYKVDDDKRNRNYFLADYFIPEFNLLVEIDSGYHDAVYDRARDEYIQEVWGTKSLRSYMYNPGSVKFRSDFDKELKCRRNFKIQNNIVGDVYIDYSDLSVDCFYFINEDIINLINKIEYLMLKKFNLRYGEFDMPLDKLSNQERFLIQNDNILQRVRFIFYSVYSVYVSIMP